MANSAFSGLGASADLFGFGGDLLRSQTADETEEEKRKKRLGLSLFTPGTSLAAQSLFGAGRATGMPGGRGF